MVFLYMAPVNKNALQPGRLQRGGGL